MLEDIDLACRTTGVPPHAVLSGHAHKYQGLSRFDEQSETPYVVCGNDGHVVNPLTKKGASTLRVPIAQPGLSNGSDQVTFESYDDQDFGYLRVVVNDKQLPIEYPPSPDGAAAKTPDDFVTVDLATHKLVPYRV